MGGGNSVPKEIQGFYKEEYVDRLDERHHTDYEYKVKLQETTFEAIFSVMVCEKHEDGNGLKMTIPVNSMLWGDVEEHGDMKKGEEIKINFITKKASSQRGGIPIPNDDYKVDFVMKYEKFQNEKGENHHSLVFVTYPKDKFEKCTGRLLGKKID